jgi:6-phosphogluconolactonase
MSEVVIAGGPEVIVEPDPEAAAETAAGRVAIALQRAIEARGRADWATTGGSTPGAIYRYLAVEPLRSALNWELVHLWWGDDRFVPRDHPLSNVQAADEILLGLAALAGESGFGEYAVDVTAGREPGARIPAENVHVFPTSSAIGQARGPEWCADVYADALRHGGVRVASDWPAFDLLLLGIGPDGHVLSVFPGSPVFDRAEWALAVAAPTHVEPHVARVTLNPAVIGVAEQVIVVAHGEAKADVIGRALGGDEQPRQLPARLAARAGATWILDAAAAAALDGHR